MRYCQPDSKNSLSYMMQCTLMRNLTSCRQASMGVSGWQGKVFWPDLARKQLAKFKANLS